MVWVSGFLELRSPTNPSLRRYLMKIKRFLCFALAGLFLFATPIFTTEVQREETDEEFEEYIEWETNDYYERDLRNGVIVE